jgi:hypothetical protein
MSIYKFQLEDFALSDEGVHLLRNQFNFRTVGYNQINRATIERSTEIKNAPLILAIGISLVCFSFYQSRWIINSFTNPEVHRIYIETIVLPIIPAFVGIYCIYISLKKAPILKLEEGSRKYKLRLKSVIKNNQAFEFANYLNQHLGSKVNVDASMKAYLF